MKKILLILFCGAAGILLSQCSFLWSNDGLSRDIWFYNNSGKAVCYYMPWTKGVLYPDTILPVENPNPWKFEKNYSYNFGEMGYTENDFFSFLKTDTMSVFFFDPDTLTAYNWETISNDYKILVRYDFSHEDLKRLKWKVTYPPTEAMKDIKMYPPYQ
jgi:hypothetical protein